MLLLKAVCGVDGHVPPHGETQARFEKALPIFVASLPAGALAHIIPPTWKTLNDRFKKVVADHRLAASRNAVASGILEVRGEREVLLDDVVLEIDDVEEKRRAERNERTELDARLRAAGEHMRAAALTGTRSSAASVDDEGNGEEQRGWKRRAVVVDSEEDEKDAIEEHIEARRMMDMQRIELDKERLALEKEKAERENELALSQQSNDAKRICLDERRINLEVERNALDREERRSAMEERKGMLAVLGALVKKLE